MGKKLSQFYAEFFGLWNKGLVLIGKTNNCKIVSFVGKDLNVIVKNKK